MKIKPIFDFFFSFIMTFVMGVSLTAMNKQSWLLIVVYSVFFIWFGYRSLVFAFKKNTAFSSIEADIKSRDSKLDMNPSYIPPFGFIMTFGLICNQLYFIDNTLFSFNTSIDSSELENYSWMIFAIDEFIRAVCLDFLETYHIHFSQINSNNNWILTFVFVFKTTLSIFFIKSIFNLYISTRRIEASYDTK